MFWFPKVPFSFAHLSPRCVRRSTMIWVGYTYPGVSRRSIPLRVTLSRILMGVVPVWSFGRRSLILELVNYHLVLCLFTSFVLLRFPSSVTAFNSNTPLFCDCSWLALMLRRLVVLFSDTHHQTTGDHSSRFNHPHFTSPQSTLIFRCSRDSPLKCAP